MDFHNMQLFHHQAAGTANLVSYERQAVKLLESNVLAAGNYAASWQQARSNYMLLDSEYSEKAEKVGDIAKYAISHWVSCVQDLIWAQGKSAIVKKIWQWLQTQKNEFEDWSFPTNHIDFWRIVNVVANNKWLDDVNFRQIAKFCGLGISTEIISVRDYVFFVFFSPNHFWPQQQHLDWFKLLAEFVNGNAQLFEDVATELEAQILIQKINFMPSWNEQKNLWISNFWKPISFSSTTEALNDLRKKLCIKPVTEAEYSVLQSEFMKILNKSTYSILNRIFSIIKPSTATQRVVQKKILIELRRMNQSANKIMSDAEMMVIGFWANYFKLYYVEQLEREVQKPWASIVQTIKKHEWKYQSDETVKTYDNILELTKIIGLSQKRGSM